MANRNQLRNQNHAAAVGAAARLVRQAREDVSSALLGVGFLTSVTAARAGAAASRSRPAAVSGALAVSLGCGLSTMWAAGWVAGDPARRRAAGGMILRASLLPLVIAVGLSDDLDFFFDILRAIMLD